MNQNNHIHTFTHTAIPPTCKNNGYTLHRCACGYEYRDSFTPMGAHAFLPVEQTAPTCTEGGKRVLRCKICGETQTLIADPLGHLWSNWQIQTVPSCTESGLQSRVCSRCGLRETETLPPRGHKLINPKKSLTNPGFTEYFCENCGETILQETVSSKFKKILSKKWVIALFVVLLLGLALVLTSPLYLPIYHYSRAQACIEDQDYKAAYLHLKDCGDYKDAEKMIADFRIEYQDYKSTSYSDGKKTGGYHTKLDEHGNEIYTASYGENGKLEMETEFKNKYDKNGNLVLKTNYDRDGEFTSKTEYKYDGYGNLYLSVSYDEDGTATSREEIKYQYTEGIITHKTEYSDGKKEYESWYNKAGDIIAYTNYFGGMKDSEYRYNEDDKEALYVSYDSNGAILYKITYKFDRNGNTILRKDYDGDENLDQSVKYRYDGDGNVILQTYYNRAEELIRKTTFEYDDGNCILETDYDLNGEFIGKCVYEYDRDGNLTLCARYTEDRDLYTKIEYEYDGDGFLKKQEEIYYNPSTREEREKSTIVNSGPIVFYEPEAK